MAYTDKTMSTMIKAGRSLGKYFDKYNKPNSVMADAEKAGKYVRGKLSKANKYVESMVSSAGAEPKVSGTKVKGGDRFAGTTSDDTKKQKDPEQSAMYPKAKAKTRSSRPKPASKPAAPKAAAPKEGFDFAGAINRGFGQTSATKVANMDRADWEKAKRRAGVPS